MSDEQTARPRGPVSGLGIRDSGIRVPEGLVAAVPKPWIWCTSDRLPGSTKTVAMDETIGTIFCTSRRGRGLTFGVRDSVFEFRIPSSGYDEFAFFEFVMGPCGESLRRGKTLAVATAAAPAPEMVGPTGKARCCNLSSSRSPMDPERSRDRRSALTATRSPLSRKRERVEVRDVGSSCTRFSH